MNYLLIAVNIVLLVTGQTLWKLGVERTPPHGIGGAIAVIFSPLVFAGVVLYAIATVIYVYLLSKLPFSLLYPLQSFAYVIGVLVAAFFFHEYVTIWRWMGVLVIIFGVALIVK